MSVLEDEVARVLQLERLGHKRETQTHGLLRSGIVTTVTTEGKAMPRTWASG